VVKGFLPVRAAPSLRIITDEQYLADIRPCERHMVEILMDGEPQFIVVDDEQIIFSSGFRPGENVRFYPQTGCDVARGLSGEA
jgi:hypothetical protein